MRGTTVLKVSLGPTAAASRPVLEQIHNQVRSLRIFWDSLFFPGTSRRTKPHGSSHAKGKLEMLGHSMPCFACKTSDYDRRTIATEAAPLCKIVQVIFLAFGQGPRFALVSSPLLLPLKWPDSQLCTWIETVDSLINVDPF